jgi:hypothetical protein
MPFGCLFMIVVVPTALWIAANLYYDAKSVTIKGVVLRKQETVKLYSKTPMVDEPFIDRTLTVHVNYQPPNFPLVMWGVTASAATFDSTHVGDVVSLRYLEAWPRITIGLAERTVRDRLEDVRAQFSGRSGKWMLWELTGFVIMLLCAGIGGWPMLIVQLAFLACSVPLFFADRGPRPVPAVTATAIVGDIEPFKTTPHYGTDASILDGRDLTQPYQSVELTYVPGPGRDSVRAVDAIDLGSAGKLVTGALVAIRYDPATPREAQLAKATRTFRSRNRFDMWPETLAPGVFGLLALLIKRKRPKKSSV